MKYRRLLAQILDSTDAAHAGDRRTRLERQSTVLLSTLKKGPCEEAIRAAVRLTNRIDKGLDLSDEIRAGWPRA